MKSCKSWEPETGATQTMRHCQLEACTAGLQDRADHVVASAALVCHRPSHLVPWTPVALLPSAACARHRESTGVDGRDAPASVGHPDSCMAVVAHGRRRARPVGCLLSSTTRPLNPGLAAPPLLAGAAAAAARGGPHVPSVALLVTECACQSTRRVLLSAAHPSDPTSPTAAAAAAAVAAAARAPAPARAAPAPRRSAPVPALGRPSAPGPAPSAPAPASGPPAPARAAPTARSRPP
mmetsp:Transcript_13161/g.55116  ORF Transcript_13161/g.55116 Transcript_13161/m.55116 type:complete len:237 (-) Transcript_13161:781-1491(-)